MGDSPLHIHTQLYAYVDIVKVKISKYEKRIRSFGMITKVCTDILF